MSLPPADTPLSKLPDFDPRKVPVIGVDAHLPPVRPEAMQPQGLRQRFAQPPQWDPEVWLERPFSQRQSLSFRSRPLRRAPLLGSTS